MAEFYEGKAENILNFYNTLNTFEDIQKLIDSGEAESQYLECKSPSSPRLDKGLKSELARIISGFSNTSGGIIIWGVKTDRHGNLDILTQIEPIGSIKNFVKELELSIPLLTEPPIQTRTKIIKEKPKDNKGLAITYVPITKGDPIRVTNENFYLRMGDHIEPMPYEVIKRMFIGANTPDLFMVLDPRLIKVDEQGRWKIPITLSNYSNYTAKNTKVAVGLNNPDACERIDFSGFIDQSDINPGKKIYITQTLREPIYKKLDSVIGEMRITMKKLKIPKRLLDLTVKIYSEGMRARYQRIKIYLFKKRFRIKEVERDYLY
jgi:hypothetical protein